MKPVSSVLLFSPASVSVGFTAPHLLEFPVTLSDFVIFANAVSSFVVIDALVLAVSVVA